MHSVANERGSLKDIAESLGGEKACNCRELRSPDEFRGWLSSIEGEGGVVAGVNRRGSAREDLRFRIEAWKSPSVPVALGQREVRSEMLSDEFLPSSSRARLCLSFLIPQSVCYVKRIGCARCIQHAVVSSLIPQSVCSRLKWMPQPFSPKLDPGSIWSPWAAPKLGPSSIWSPEQRHEVDATIFLATIGSQ